MKKRTKPQQQKNLQKNLKDKSAQTFADHVGEIRRRLFILAFFFFIGSVVAYYFRLELLSIIMAPLHGQKLIYLTPGGGFTFIFQIVIYAGLILSAPVFVYQLHAFIRPALPSQAQKSVLRLTLLSTLLICGGISYGYFVAVPAAIDFLGTFAEGAIASNMTADSYLSFFLAYIGGLALLSLIPLVVIFWHWISPINPSKLYKSEQWVAVLAFVLAAIITPTPDAFNQAMIAGPIIAVYQIGVVSVAVSIMRAKRRQKVHRNIERAAQNAENQTSLPVPKPMPVASTVVATAPATVHRLAVNTSDVVKATRVSALSKTTYSRTLRPLDGVSASVRPRSNEKTHSAPAARTNYVLERTRSIQRPSSRLSVDGLVRL